MWDLCEGLNLGWPATLRRRRPMVNRPSKNTTMAKPALERRVPDQPDSELREPKAKPNRVLQNTGEFWMRALTVCLLLGSSMLAFAQEAGFPSESLSKKFAQSVNNGDAAALASFYTDDAYVLPPGAPRS